MRGAYKKCKSSSSHAALAMHAVTADIDSMHLQLLERLSSKQTLSWVLHAAKFAHSSNKYLQVWLEVRHI